MHDYGTRYNFYNEMKETTHKKTWPWSKKTRCGLVIGRLKIKVSMFWRRVTCKKCNKYKDGHVSTGVLVFLLVALAGCGQMTNPFSNVRKETSVKTDEHSTAQGIIQGKIEAEYPEPTSYQVTASGNARVTIAADGHRGIITLRQNERKEAQEEVRRKFSFDEAFESVSILGWLFISLAFALFVFSWIAWQKFTATGRAADAAVGAGIRQVQKGLSKATAVLEDSSPGTEEHKSARRLRDDLQGDLHDLHKDEGRRRSFFQPHTWK